MSYPNQQKPGQGHASPRKEQDQPMNPRHPEPNKKERGGQGSNPYKQSPYKQ